MKEKGEDGDDPGDRGGGKCSGPVAEPGVSRAFEGVETTAKGKLNCGLPAATLPPARLAPTYASVVGGSPSTICFQDYQLEEEAEAVQKATMESLRLMDSENPNDELDWSVDDEEEEEEFEISPEGTPMVVTQQETVLEEEKIVVDYPGMEEEQPSPPKKRVYENQQWYSQDFQEQLPKDRVLRAVKMEDIPSINAFIEYTESRRNSNDVYRYHKAPEKPSKFTIITPSGRSVVYVAAYDNGSSWKLTPAHLEVVGGLRPDLHFIDLTNTSMDLASDRVFDLADVKQGDLFYVMNVRRNNKASPSDYMKSMEKVNSPEDHKFWKVTGAVRLPRHIMENKLARQLLPNGTPEERLIFAVEDLAMPAVVAVESLKDLPEGTTKGWMKVRVMVPVLQPGQNVRSFRPKTLEEEAEARALMYTHCPIWSLQATILEVKPVDKETAAFLEDGPNQFKPNGPVSQKQFDLVTRITKLGYFGELTLDSYRADPRCYNGEVLEQEETSKGVFVKIALDDPTICPIHISRWQRNTQLVVKLKEEEHIPAILRLADKVGTKFVISIKVARNKLIKWKDLITKKVFVRHHLETIDEQVRREIGSLRAPPFDKNMPALQVVVALHGGAPIPEREETGPVNDITFKDWTSRGNQGRLVPMLEDQTLPGGLMSCPFGTGKTSTIMNSIAFFSQQNRKLWSVFTAQSNNAIVQGIRQLEVNDEKGEIAMVRLISRKHRKKLDPALRTAHDFPVLWPRTLMTAFKLFNQEELTLTKTRVSATRHLLNYGYIKLGEIKSRFLQEECRKPYKKDPPACCVYECLMRYLLPKIITGTATSIRGVFGSSYYMREQKDRVRNMVIDEASLLSRYTFLALAFTFPRTKIILVGDHRQLPPHRDARLPKVYDKFGNGPIFKETVEKKLMPSVDVDICFRCPAQITRVLSTAFYEGQLKSSKAEEARTPVLEDIGLETGYPMVWIDSFSTEIKEGTSTKNIKEALMARRIVERLLTEGVVKAKNIAVICYYLAQSALLSRILPREVTVTTVDGSQGSEFDIVLLLTSKVSDFHKSPFIDNAERLNVGLSRSKMATIVLFNQRSTTVSKPWKTVMKHIPKRVFKQVREDPQLAWLDVDKAEIEDFSNSC